MGNVLWRVRWASPVPVDKPGVYTVATTDDIADDVGLVDCPLDRAALRSLLQVRPEVRVDGVLANEATLATRLSSMWVAGEPIVYIGLAGTSLADRIGRYYSTPIGALVGGRSRCWQLIGCGSTTPRVRIPTLPSGRWHWRSPLAYLASGSPR